MKLIQMCLGLGDHIALSGACVVLAERHGGLIVPCLKKNMPSVEAIFAQCDGLSSAPIEVRELESVRAQWESGDRIIALEERIPEQCDVDHYRWIYRKLGIDYEERWNSCPIAEAAKLVRSYPLPAGPFVFVHEDADRKFYIDIERTNYGHLDVVYPLHDNHPILAYRYAIQMAEEVHCIDSAFFHLVEQLEPKGRLFLHRYSRPYYPGWCDYKTKKDWIILC